MACLISVSPQGKVSAVHQVLLRDHHSIRQHQYRCRRRCHRSPSLQKLSATRRQEALAGFLAAAVHEERPNAWEVFSLVPLACVRLATAPSMESASKRKVAIRALREHAIYSVAPANVALLIVSTENVSANLALARWMVSAHRHARRPQESVAISSAVVAMRNVRTVPVSVARTTATGVESVCQAEIPQRCGCRSRQT